ncbi:hypothetical protein BDV34DRAFT_141887 [Aspergillus parasiticus]|uniref:Uncharacterized protein n=1 Tax=Aspergillus parasiticus TaxID=5067 RepID=A0A5N6DDK9_ASPPA|nr:hypothetical protein BDV34DRAFT_141887 [Aspergillus parasiticus]
MFPTTKVTTTTMYLSRYPPSFHSHFLSFFFFFFACLAYLITFIGATEAIPL